MTDNNTEKLQETKKMFLEQLLGQQFKELGLSDLMAIQEKSQDPLVLSVLVFKLLEERRETNKILKDIQEKYDKLQFSQTQRETNVPEIAILSETDDRIITYIREKGKADAEEIRESFGYKGTNAASQRLNNLVKARYLQKINSGRKVYFVVK
ncbi:MAG: hypothetical protein WCX82_01085 [archaeon]|jgi:hypothetical protein